jgi:hypothetical protein
MLGISLRILIGLAVLLLAAATHAQAVVSLSDPAANASFQLAPGVIVAPRAGSVYVQALAGIDALDARSLRVRAHTTLAALPLLVSEGQLLALVPGSKLQLVWLDAQSLRRTVSCAPMELPERWAASALDVTPGRSSWSADVGDAVYVRFATSMRHMRAPESASESSEPWRGAIRVDPQTGATELVARAPVSSAPANFALAEPIRAGPFFVQGLSMVVSVLGGESKRVRVERRRLSDGVRLPTLSFPLPASKGLLSLERGVLWIAEPGADGAITGARLIGTSRGNELVHVPFTLLPDAFLSVGRRAWFIAEGGLGTLELNTGARSPSRPLLGRTEEPAAPNVATATAH